MVKLTIWAERITNKSVDSQTGAEQLVSWTPSWSAVWGATDFFSAPRGFGNLSYTSVTPIAFSGHRQAAVWKQRREIFCHEN